jgi:hypothetical protein
MTDRDSPELPPKVERRPATRRRVIWRGRGVHVGGGYDFECTIRDFSDTGARIAVRGAPMIPSHFYLVNVTTRTVHEVKVVWNDGKLLGLRFLQSFPVDAIPDPELLYLKGFAR